MCRCHPERHVVIPSVSEGSAVRLSWAGPPGTQRRSLADARDDNTARAHNTRSLRQKLDQRARDPVDRCLLERVRRTRMHLELTALQLANRGRTLLDRHRGIAVADAHPNRVRDAREDFVGETWAGAE